MNTQKIWIFPLPKQKSVLLKKNWKFIFELYSTHQKDHLWKLRRFLSDLVSGYNQNRKNKIILEVYLISGENGRWGTVALRRGEWLIVLTADFIEESEMKRRVQWENDAIRIRKVALLCHWRNYKPYRVEEEKQNISLGSIHPLIQTYF